jgi:polyisoprenoid-binding protein YceI
MILFLTVLAHAQAHPIDTKQSTVTIHVFKSGLFSAFAHNHTISAPITSGEIDTGARTVKIGFRSADLRVLDPDVSAKDRAEVQKTMETDVLAIQQFPEITFVSRTVQPSDANNFKVNGDLTIHGVTKPIELPVAFASGRYMGSVKIKQTDFGITPVKVAGGTVKVKDEIEIEFQVVPAP